jgi:hypothetical protein
MSSRSPQAGDQMRRQLAKQLRQQKQQEQEQQARQFGGSGRELQAKQDQTRHNPVSESQQGGSFTSDQ